LALTGNSVPAAWDGSTGGLVALDILVGEFLAPPAKNCFIQVSSTMFADSHAIHAGGTVAHPRFAQLAMPVHAVVVEVLNIKNTPHAELDNGLCLPLLELQPVATGEQWAAIAGYEYYQLSSHGKVVSLCYRGQARQRLLKVLNASRYPEIRLGNRGIFLRIGLNRLVAQTFLPPPAAESLDVVIPKDGNRLNVCAHNLQWVSLGETADRATWRYLRGYRTRAPHCKLQAADIAQIRLLATQGVAQQAIASKFGVSRPTISVLLSGTGPRLNEG
jgi:hypothetical protein